MYNLLRWVFFLPMAIICTFIALYAIHYLNIWTLSIVEGHNQEGLLYKFLDKILKNITVGCVFVYVGSYIVPNLKRYVALLLCALISSFSFYYCFIVNKEFSLGLLFEFVITLVSSIFTALTFYEGKNPEID